MSFSDTDSGIVASTRLITDRLNDRELAAIYNAATANFDLKGVLGYEKINPLLTEDNGTRMHQETVRALGIIVTQRLGKG